MALSDFLRREATVSFDGRLFVCSRPTLRTVLLALDLYGRAIYAAREIVKGEDVDPRQMVVELAVQNPKTAAQLLRTCVRDAANPAREIPENRELVRGLAQAVASMTDFGRIAESLNLDKLDSSEAEEIEDDGPTGLEAEILMFAERFRVSPESVADWSYECYLGVRDWVKFLAQRSEQSRLGMSDEFMREIRRTAPNG